LGRLRGNHSRLRRRSHLLGMRGRPATLLTYYTGLSSQRRGLRALLYRRYLMDLLLVVLRLLLYHLLLLLYKMSHVLRNVVVQPFPPSTLESPPPSEYDWY